MIEPNEVYIINKLNFASQANVLAKICTTLQDVKGDPLDPYIFLEYVSKALAFGRCIIFVTFNENQELNSCAVTLVNNVPSKGRILWIEWAWSDGKDLNLGKKVLKRMEEIAQKIEANTIAGAMQRGFGGVLRKYGFKVSYRVIEKEVKKNVEKD